jgi:hypothetical protein
VNQYKISNNALTVHAVSTVSMYMAVDLFAAGTTGCAPGLRCDQSVFVHGTVATGYCTAKGCGSHIVARVYWEESK